MATMTRMGPWAVAAVSLLVFGLGLASPLTPSIGCPSAADVGLFGGGPVVLLGTAAASARGRLASFLLWILTIVLTTTTLLLLRVLDCLG